MKNKNKLIVEDVENVRFVSQHPHELNILARFGLKNDGATLGVSTSFETMSPDEALNDFDMFKSERPGQDWVMRFDLAQSGKSVTIK